MEHQIEMDVVAKMQPVVDGYRDGLFNSMKAGIENAEELAKQNSITKLSKSCESALEGTENMIKLFDNLCDNIENYISIMKKVEEQTQ